MKDEENRQNDSQVEVDKTPEKSNSKLPQNIECRYHKFDIESIDCMFQHHLLLHIVFAVCGRICFDAVFIFALFVRSDT